MKRLIIAISIGILSIPGLQLATAADVRVSVTFSDAEIRTIRDWYHDHESLKDGKSGKGKDNRLPPGIAKNLTRGKSLPPGIAKQHFPDGLRQDLPAPPGGYERIIVGGKILLVETATQVIHDVLMDVIFD